MLTANAATTTIVVNAGGTATTECTGLLIFQTCNDIYAEFDLYVQGVKVGATQTTTGSYQNYTFNNVTVPSTGTFNVDVHFINDYSCDSSSLLGLSSCSGDRNIGINSVTVGSQAIAATGNTVDAGNSYAQATDGITTYAYSVGLYENSALRLMANPQTGPPYDFPNNLPPGCTGSGGNYTCNINTEMDYDVTFSDTGDVTVNHYGRYDLAAGRSVGTATQTANVTINIVSAVTSATNIDLATGTNVYANFNTSSYSSTYDVDITMDGTATMHGNIISDNPKNFNLDMNDDSVLNGDVDANATTYIFITLYNNATINGNVSAETVSTSQGPRVRIRSAGASINGNVTAANRAEISNRGTITGCALLSGNHTSAEIELISGSTTGSICQGSVGACAASSTYLRNFTGTTPPDCTGPAELIAEYHLDEESWDGGGKPVKDTAGYTGGPFDGEVYTGAPVPTNSNPARAVGNDGTCGYAYFPQSSSSSAFRMVGLPIDTATLAKTSVNFWVYWNGIDTSIPIGWGANALFFRSGRLGFGTNTYALHGISSAGLANRWVHVTAVFTNGSSGDNALYIDGVKQTLSVTQNSPLSSHWMSTDLSVSGYGYNSLYRLQDSYVDEVKVYRGAMTQAQVTADYNAVHACPNSVINTPASQFNCVATGADADTGHLYLQKVSTGFNVDVVALKADRSVEDTFAAASNQDVTVELVDGAGATDCAARAVLSPTVSQTLTFIAADAGRKSTTMTVDKAYRDLRCRVTDANQSPAVVGCSSDDFAVRPENFVISTNANADATGLSATNTPTFIASGDAFTVNVASAPGYDGTPLIAANGYGVGANMRVTGALTGNFSAANSANGTATGTNFKYSEAGYFNFLANGVYDDSFTAVDSANGDCVSGLSASGGLFPCRIFNDVASDSIGRFIPQRFDVVGSSLQTSAQCSSGNFTYFGQDGLTTQFILKVQNVSGATVRNYHGDFAKLDLTTWTDTSAATGYRFLANNLPAGVTLANATPPVINSNWHEGEATVTVKHVLSRPATPVSPTTIVFRTDPIDEDGVNIVYSSPEIISQNANSQFWYGRLAVNNAYGSELHDLTLPVIAQYWDGTTYRNNTVDSCSNIATANVTLGNYQKQLAAGETTLSGGGTLNAGKINLQLSAPEHGNHGSVDLTFNLSALPWFGITAPVARATFGLYKSPIIYMRENY